MTAGSAGRASVLLLGGVAVLVGLRPHPATLVRELLAPHAWIARVGTDAAAAQLAGTAVWVVTAWLTVGIAATLLASAPGTLGRFAGRLSAGMLPGMLRLALAGTLGMTIATAPALAGAAPATGSGARAAVAVAAAPSPGWPQDPRTPRAVPTPRWPGSAARPTDSGGGAGDGDGQVVVRPGDSLWAIAAHRLGPGATDRSIAAQWPRWYRANAAVIGADPGLIRPGERLQAPDGAGALDPAAPPTDPAR